MKKKVKLTLEDGRIYSIDAHVVAHDRASYYEKLDRDVTYQEEYDYTMSSQDTMLDWLFNNMDWYDHNPVMERPPVLANLQFAVVEDSSVEEV